MTGPTHGCPACRSSDLELFFEQSGVPAHSCLLMGSASEARSYSRGSIEMAFCRSCGFIFNQAFDPSLSHYSSSYEETQGFSPKFRDFARSLANRWIDTYDIRDKTVLEIGCGKGEFLVLMCELGNNTGIGIDPSYLPERLDSSAADRMTFFRELYSESHSNIEADVVVCRHTLEHIPDVARFLALVRRGIGARTDVAVLFEIPDVLRVLKETAFWDIYYEHCSYFSQGSLARLFRAGGFDVLDLALDFDDQYVLLEARPVDGAASGARLAAEDDLAEVAAAVEQFRSTYARRLAGWREDLGRMTAGDRRAVIWGAGSKGVSYLTSLDLEGAIEYAVDINPYKQGMYLAGTGKQVVGPEFLKGYRPDAVIAMNAIYRDEIRRELDALGVEAELLTV